MIKFDTFAWMVSNNVNQWNLVNETVGYLNGKGVTFGDSIYEGIIYVNCFIEAEMSDE